MGARQTSRLVARFVLGLSLLLPLRDQPAEASQIFYQDVSLPAAISKATLVVCARYLGADPRHFGAHRFRVGRVVSGTGPVAGQDIHVFTIEAWAWDMIRRAHRATGVRRSPILDRLPSPPSAPLRPDGFYCLLLTAGPGQDYKFAVSDGHVPAPCGEVGRMAGAR
jgi:hypothetical protein